MKTITMKVWKQTHSKLKILAAYGEKTMLDTLDEVVQMALERKEEERRSRERQCKEEIGEK